MDWAQVVNYGLPMTLLAVLVLGLWKVLAWARTAVVEPVVQAHMSLLATMKEHVALQTVKLEEVSRLAAEVATANRTELVNVRKAVDEQTTILKQAIDTQTRAVERK
jgi:hypothetical protein